MLRWASKRRSRIGASLMRRLGIERVATTWFGPAPVLLVLGRTLGCWCGGDNGSRSAGIGWLASSGDPRGTSPLAGREVAMSAKPTATSSPAIRFRLIPPIIVRRGYKPVKQRNAGVAPSSDRNTEGAGIVPGALFRTVWLRGLAGGLADVGLAHGLGERPERLLRSRTPLQPDPLSGEGVGAFPSLACLDVTRCQA